MVDGKCHWTDGEIIGISVKVVPPPPPQAIGGEMIPVDKLVLLVPYIGLASTILVAAVATAVYIKRIKYRERRKKVR